MFNFKNSFVVLVSLLFLLNCSDSNAQKKVGNTNIIESKMLQKLKMNSLKFMNMLKILSLIFEQKQQHMSTHTTH